MGISEQGSNDSVTSETISTDLTGKVHFAKKTKGARIALKYLRRYLKRLGIHTSKLRHSARQNRLYIITISSKLSSTGSKTMTQENMIALY
ncbi:MAG: transposase [Arsenophonus sp. NEOnobi-MAG3]